MLSPACYFRVAPLLLPPPQRVALIYVSFKSLKNGQVSRRGKQNASVQLFSCGSNLLQVIATRPKNQRRVGRRGSAKSQVLGNPANAATRAAAQSVAAAKVVAAATPASQSADKIIVSNLPADVNEVQIKVLDSR